MDLEAIRWDSVDLIHLS